MAASEEALTLVAEFHRLWNAKEPAALLDLAIDDIRIGGSRGSGTGKHLLEEWVSRANMTLTPQRIFARDGVVAVEQLAEWRDGTTGDVTSSQTMATTFRVDQGKFVAIARFSHFAEAANKAGLDEDDAVNR